MELLSEALPGVGLKKVGRGRDLTVHFTEIISGGRQTSWERTLTRELAEEATPDHVALLAKLYHRAVAKADGSR